MVWRRRDLGLTPEEKKILAAVEIIFKRSLTVGRALLNPYEFTIFQIEKLHANVKGPTCNPAKKLSA